jgi:hypothetical protein
MWFAYFISGISNLMWKNFNNYSCRQSYTAKSTGYLHIHIYTKNPKRLDKQGKQISGQNYQIDLLPTSSAKLATLMAFFLPSRHSLAISKRLQNISVHTVFNCLWVDTKKHLYRKKLIATRPLQRNYASHTMINASGIMSSCVDTSNVQLDQLTTKVLCLRCDEQPMSTPIWLQKTS